MIAKFYIIAESFRQNPNLSVAEIEKKIKSLAMDYVYIRRYKETNKLFIHPDIYQVNFVNGVSIEALLFNEEEANNHLDRDVRNSFKKIIWETDATSVATQDIKDALLPSHNENICHGLIAFNIVPNVNPEYQIVYDSKGWLSFRRYFLSLYPKNENFYINECMKYFPLLYVSL